MLERLLEQTLNPPTTTETNKESETKKPAVRFFFILIRFHFKILIEKENTNNN
jgi:hypothetical protein